MLTCKLLLWEEHFIQLTGPFIWWSTRYWKGNICRCT